jgi:hypothetical protein
LLLAALTVAASTSSCKGASADGIQGSGTVKADKRAVSGFTQVVINGPGDATIARTGSDSLVVEADDNLLPVLTSTVAGGRLTLGPKEAIRSSKMIHYAITVKDLTGVEVSGAGKVSITGVDTDRFKVVLNGAGALTASGRAQSQDVELSGAGAYDASQLASKSAKVEMSGAGAGTVQVSDALDVRISGVGSLEYIGDPKVTKSVTGIGSVHKR